jgi:DNA topoisomerase-1
VEATGIDPKQGQRVVFHEITKDAVAEAFAHPRQQPAGAAHPRPAGGLPGQPAAVGQGAARAVGGRVQSVAVRIVVEREREITLATTNRSA